MKNNDKILMDILDKPKTKKARTAQALRALLLQENDLDFGIITNFCRLLENDSDYDLYKILYEYRYGDSDYVNPWSIVQEVMPKLDTRFQVGDVVADSFDLIYAMYVIQEHIAVPIGAWKKFERPTMKIQEHVGKEEYENAVSKFSSWI